MVQLHILEAVLEFFFLACPAANKRHKRQLINRAVPNLAVTTFLVGGSPLAPLLPLQFPPLGGPTGKNWARGRTC